ncbi:shikimate dehydrogenase [Calycomorphotria hydatis]|uniref:Multifunctional fusion protein n=1 Tax=Calycomorphotria hydatis TaxID=2528027 RepID=A0A517TAB8_9PLAN|nr:shikimate dehydrogenase [Calycomorphotria hydatis]QDT65318.1 Shikimate dehydrogenase [Calycomorphotria hydatis]
MICVSIGRTRHEMMLAEMRALQERGAELAELRIDWLKTPIDLPRLIRERPLPCVVTCRRAEDQGKWLGTEEQRLSLLRQAIMEGVEYVDLEVDVAAKIPRYGKTKRIVSYHDFLETPDDIDEIHRKLSDADADVVKLVTLARHPSDNIRVLELVRTAKVPTVGFCMSEQGLVSRLLCGRFGAPFSYASFSSERSMAPGQVSFDDMKNKYHYDSIGPNTKLFGVMGDPVGHSLSPAIHNAALREQGIDAVYLPIFVPSGSFRSAVADYGQLGFEGFSVTIPHKEEAMRSATEADEQSRAIGASNTLVKNKNGDWLASNTDYDAALSSMLDGLRQHEPAATIAGRKVLILGAGGVSRAIASALVNAGAVVTLTGRTHKRAEGLAVALGCQVVRWENRGTDRYDIIVNGTPVGMHPNVDQTPFAENLFPKHALVYDTIYNPEHTLFLKQAEQHECFTVSGVEMFVRQAAAQFEQFTGKKAPVDVMRREFRRAISAAKW